jgi:phosphoribosylamine--glycine ligase
MGVVGPMQVDSVLLEKINSRVVTPSNNGIKSKGWTYRGLLYIGLMVVDGNPYVLEYNVRFGDPEAQCIFPLLDGDWARVFFNTARGELSELSWKKLNTCCVVVAAPGYPDQPKKGEKILGDLTRDGGNAYILHAGTKKQDSNWLSNGGRVLNAVALGLTQNEANERAYQLVGEIHWPTKQFRRDIGKN